MTAIKSFFRLGSFLSISVFRKYKERAPIFSCVIQRLENNLFVFVQTSMACWGEKNLSLPFFFLPPGCLFLILPKQVFDQAKYASKHNHYSNNCNLIINTSFKNNISHLFLPTCIFFSLEFMTKKTLTSQCSGYRITTPSTPFNQVFIFLGL